ncbi:MAG: helix-turn-helix transcriptional regulator [Patescibacteria group bacterium]|nr:helix-turn-helix transcriptional regulator [Patescibacteria group bacterium]
MNKKEDKIRQAEKDIKYEISDRIQAVRKAKNLPAKTVANYLGISRSALTHIETGRNNVSGAILWKLAIALNCNVGDFFPNTPEGFSLTKSDLEKLKEEDKRSVDFAKRCFNNKNNL